MPTAAGINNYENKRSALVIAGSDFQLPVTSLVFYGKTSYTEQIKLVETIAGNIYREYPCAEYYGFFGGGDYNFDEIKEKTAETEDGIQAVKAGVKNVFRDIDINMLFIHGNHDSPYAPSLVSSGSNGYDTDYYGVFVMNENEYRSYPLLRRKWQDCEQSEAIAKKLADELDTYLAGRLEKNADKPVFIVSHVPLHFSTRTAAKADAIYADYFVDVLNKYGEKLNIFFMYGHNHAWGDDDYLGGGSVFLKKGEILEIAAHGSVSESEKQKITLGFTYMNCGYMGYLWDKWSGSYDLTKNSGDTAPIQNPGADNTLTMTSFYIEGNRVTVARWDESGMHVLKAGGAASLGKRDDCNHEVCEVNTAVVPSPQLVSME